VDILIVAVVLAAMAAVLWWLARTNARDRAALAGRLGLHEVARGPTEALNDPILGRSTQSVILEGRLHGLPARVWLRTVRRPEGDGTRSRVSFTVLSFEVPGTSLRLRLSPARTGAIAAMFGDDWPGWLTGDPEFDQAYRLSTPAPEAAAAVFSPEVRQRWLALRAARSASFGDAADAGALGRLAGDLLVGTLVLDRGRLEYVMPGTVTPGLVEHLARAAPEVAAIALRLGATAGA
jgi:hypothetical protein